MKISNTTKYAIYHLVDNGKNAYEIAKELKISQKNIEQVINERVSEIKPIQAKDLMITETSQKRTKNVAIMTEAASMMIDSKKSMLTAETKQDRMSSSTIHHPFNNK